MYRNAIVRTSSVPYSLTNLKDKYTHLTNHCIQKGHSDFGTMEEGNEVLFPEFDVYIRESFPSRSLGGDVVPQLKDIMLKSIQSIERCMLKPLSLSLSL